MPEVDPIAISAYGQCWSGDGVAGHRIHFDRELLNSTDASSDPDQQRAAMLQALA
jgi:hypothetical protein